jgi:hypothetical protein
VEQSREINIRSFVDSRICQSGRVHCSGLRHKETNRFTHGQSQSQSKSHGATDGQSASLSWYQAPSGVKTRVAGLLMWGHLSDEMTGLLFAIAAGPRQRSNTYCGHTQQNMSSILKILHVRILHSKLSRVRFLMDTCYIQFYM